MSSNAKPDTFRYLSEPKNIQNRCIFCKIAHGEIKPGGKNNPQELLFENERIVAFHDISPGAKFHILIIPKRHLKNCWDLTPDLLNEMEDIANDLLQKKNIENESTTMFFIRPPWNSVFHVHLHAMILPLTDSFWSLRRLGYTNPWFHVTPFELRMHWEST